MLLNTVSCSRNLSTNQHHVQQLSHNETILIYDTNLINISETTR